MLHHFFLKSQSEKSLPFKVKRNVRAKRMILRLDREGEVVVTAPKHVALRTLQNFVERHQPWIEKQRAKVPQAQKITQAQTLLLFGEDYTITPKGTLRGAIELQTHDGENKILVPGDVAAAPRRIKTYLKKTALAKLTHLSAHYCARLGVECPKISIKDTKSRWGSCAKRGGLMYSWRLIMAPSAVLEYVVAHEVAHIKHFDHSKAYWDLVEELLPSYKAPQAWLKHNGSMLHRYIFD